MSDGFAIEGLVSSEALIAALNRLGITEPTPVQRAAIPVLLAGQDAILQSGTGTGKTLAYLLPLLQRVRGEAAFTAVVLAPSPELALQILRVVDLVKGPGIGSCGLVGGGNTERQKEKLKQHPRVIVGTPGRVFEMIFARKLKTARISALVLDETDALLSEQNERDLREIASRPEFSPQIIIASATIGPRAAQLATDLMDPGFARIALGTASLSPTITHHFWTFEPQRKEVWLLKLLEKAKVDRAIVFVSKLSNVAHLYRFLNDRNVPSVAISRERSKRDREESMRFLRRGEVQVLIATDTAARGLDIPGLDWVIHYDVARDEETYVHRAGRTGRNGRAGTSVMIVAPNERFLLKRYGEGLGITFTAF
jgi:superfamily II DNA/RNA helicase